MIQNNFSVIIAKKRLKISTIHRATGISRTTLTKLYYDDIHMINLEVIDKLCKFLDCKLEDIFTYQEEDWRHKKRCFIFNPKNCIPLHISYINPKISRAFFTNSGKIRLPVQMYFFHSNSIINRSDQHTIMKKVKLFCIDSLSIAFSFHSSPNTFINHCFCQKLFITWLCMIIGFPFFLNSNNP